MAEMISTESAMQSPGRQNDLFHQIWRPSVHAALQLSTLASQSLSSVSFILPCMQGKYADFKQVGVGFY